MYITVITHCYTLSIFRITGMNKFYILTRCIEIIYIYNWVWHQNDVKQSALNPSKNSHTTNHSFFLLVTEGQYLHYFAIFYTHMVRTILRTISRRISITHILGHRAWLLDGDGGGVDCAPQFIIEIRVAMYHSIQWPIRTRPTRAATRGLINQTNGNNIKELWNFWQIYTDTNWKCLDIFRIYANWKVSTNMA